MEIEYWHIIVAFVPLFLYQTLGWWLIKCAGDKNVSEHDQVTTLIAALMAAVLLSVVWPLVVFIVLMYLILYFFKLPTVW